MPTPEIVKMWKKLPEWRDLDSPDEFLSRVKSDLADWNLYLGAGEESEISPEGEFQTFTQSKEEIELRLFVPARKAGKTSEAYRGFLSWFLDRYVDLLQSSGKRFGLSFPRHEMYELEESISLNPEELQTSRGLDSILQSFVGIIYDIFDCDACRLFWQENEQELRLRAAVPSDMEKITLEIGEDPLIQSVLNEGKGVLINDLPKEGEGERAARGFRSFISVPFRLEEQVFGTVNISSEAKDYYTQEQLNKLSNFCDNLAGVYSIAQDFANLTEYVEELLLELPVGVVNVRLDSDEVVLNPVARELLSLQSDSLELSEFHDHIRDNLNSDQLEEIVRESRHSDLTGPTDVELDQSKGAHPTVISVIRSSVRNVEGEVAGALMVLTDVTEQRLLNRQINRTERLTALGELASSLAHEIKTPLTSINGFAQMVPRKIDDEEFLERMAGVVQKESERLNSLVENLLSFGRPQVEAREVVKLQPIIDDLVVLIDKKLEKKEITLAQNYSEELVIYGDEAKLKQVFLNLLLNAIDAVEKGGNIEINAEQIGDGFVQIKVIDDGDGMPEEVRSKLFNPFFTTKEEGSGLGMAITHRIVEEHAGEIEVESAPGTGTEVSLTFPSEEEVVT